MEGSAITQRKCSTSHVDMPSSTCERDNAAVASLSTRNSLPPPERHEDCGREKQYHTRRFRHSNRSAQARGCCTEVGAPDSKVVGVDNAVASSIGGETMAQPPVGFPPNDVIATVDSAV